MRTIVITSCPLSTNKNEVFAMAKNDKQLVDVIGIFGKGIKKSEDIETFFQKDNIIVTNKCYFCAFFEDDLELKPSFSKNDLKLKDAFAEDSLKLK